MYTFGVFGFTSSAYWWARLGGAAVRVILLLAPRAAALWIQMMADDLKIESTSSDPKFWVLWAVLMLRALGFPLSWKKVQGGNILTWIGYSVNLLELSPEISAARAQWASGWLRRAARDGVVEVADMRAALGRLAFIAGALECEKPFLAPLFSFISLYPNGGPRQLPLYAR